MAEGRDLDELDELLAKKREQLEMLRAANRAKSESSDLTDLYEGLADDLMDRLAKAEAATETKEALIHVGHAHISLLHAIFLETRQSSYERSRLSGLELAVNRIERAMIQIVEELQEIKRVIDAKRT